MVSEENMINPFVQLAGFDLRRGKDSGIDVSLRRGDNG
jgi:hypothetical protein